MANPVKPVPEGMHTVTAHLVVNDGQRALEFYNRAFGAEERSRVLGPDGKGLMHAELKIGDSLVFLADEFPGSKLRSPQNLGGTTVALNIYVADCDALFDRAVKAGAQVVMPLADQFWGDRYGQLADPFGHVWAIATHKEDPTPEEMKHRMQEAFAKMKA
jgi:uncharacterized glyoxalase superfamily protein PhnB